MGLNDRQINAIEYLKENGKIPNTEYQQLNSISKETATRDLKEMIEKYISYYNEREKLVPDLFID
jgi:ATP-dependent DNA helicase RecG